MVDLTESGVFRAMDKALDQKIKPLERKTEKIGTLLEGPVGEPEKGFIFRLLTVERISRSLVWLATIVVGGIVLAAIKTGFDKMFP